MAYPPPRLVGQGRAEAVDCLTAAVYYEAANEPLEGREAVAQVVLNRVRDPAYPKTVCGVVYQGSERRTGCQFTFTCDGSLNRQPSARKWAAAREVAERALAGELAPGVGRATHYHADYVSPYWRWSLQRISQIGRHIFYERSWPALGAGRIRRSPVSLARAEPREGRRIQSARWIDPHAQVG